MKKLNALGIGPKIGMVAIPYFIIALLLSIYFHSLFTFSEGLRNILWFVGIIFISVGVVFYVFTVIFLLKGVKNNRLITAGTYYLCQNPLYSSIILMIVPGLSFVMNSWLILTTSFVAYIMFKINIHTEYAEVEEFFGDSYREYRKTTPELFPFPIKKIFGQ